MILKLLIQNKNETRSNKLKMNYKDQNKNHKNYKKHKENIKKNNKEFKEKEKNNYVKNN